MWPPLKLALDNAYSAFGPFLHRLLCFWLCAPHNELLQLLHLQFRLIQKRKNVFLWSSLLLMMEKKKYPIGPEHYTLYEEVGQGVSASVHRALCKPLDAIVAIKILDFERDNCDLVLLEFYFLMFWSVFEIPFGNLIGVNANKAMGPPCKCNWE